MCQGVHTVLKGPWEGEGDTTLYVDEDKICIGSYDLKFVWVCYAMGRYNSLPVASNKFRVMVPYYILKATLPSDRYQIQGIKLHV